MAGRKLRTDLPLRDAEARGRYYVEALGRGLAVLDCFIGGPAKLSLPELSARIGASKGTTFRMLKTLEEAGFLQQDGDSKQFELTLKMLDLQEASLSALGLPALAHGLLEDLNATVGESVSMAVLDKTEIRYVARVAAKAIMSVNLHVGSRLPSHCTSLGKVLLAGLDDSEVRARYSGVPLREFTEATITSLDALLQAISVARRQGYALSNEELEVGLRSVAAPVRNGAGATVAAVNISSSTARVTADVQRSVFVPTLVSTCAAISRRLGWRGSQG